TAVGATVGGANTNANRLTAIGISFANSGQLTINDTRLDQALNGEVPGVSISDFRTLFALTGSSTSPGVSFLLGSDKTQPTPGIPYQVDVTRAATAAQFSGADLAATISLTSSNNTFALKVNGVTSAPLTLDAKDYTRDELVAAIQAKINADS